MKHAPTLLITLFLTPFAALRADDSHAGPAHGERTQPPAKELTIPVAPPSSGSGTRVFEDALRQLRSADGLRNLEKATLLVSDGTYAFDRTLVLNRQSLSHFSGRLVIAAAPGARPVIVGSQDIAGWQPAVHKQVPEAARGKVWVARLPTGFAPKTLYDRAGSLPRSRSAGFLPDASGTHTGFSCPAQLLPAGASLAGMELSVRPSFIWCHNILPVASLDVAAGRGTTALPATYPMAPLKAWGPQGGEIKEAAWLENHPAFISRPGHWAVDPASGALHLWPRDGTPPTGIRAGRLIELLRIEGDEASAQPLANITLRGLAFSQADRESLGPDDAGLQHDWDFMDKGNAMLRLRWVENITVEDCHFVESGASGLRADLYARNVHILGNTFRGLGGGGILFCGYGPGTKDLNKDNEVIGNRIEDCARLIWHMPGIHLWQSGGNKVFRNLIRDLPYSGIIVSGAGAHHFKKSDQPKRELERTIRWGEVPEQRHTTASIQPFLHSRNNAIQGNEITRVLGTLGDGNGIYIRFSSETGNVIRGNYIHHIAQVRAAGGIRCDGGQNGVTVEGNLIHRVPMTGISSNGRNTLRNNFLVDVLNHGNSPRAASPYVKEYMLLWNKAVSGSDISRNVFLDTGNSSPKFFDLTYAPWLGPTRPVLEDLALANNLYWVRGNPSWAVQFVADLHRRKLDPGSLAADPGMKTGPDGRITFDEKVLARQQIKPFDWDAVGMPQTGSDRRSAAETPTGSFSELHPDSETKK